MIATNLCSRLTGLKRSPFGQTSLRFEKQHHVTKTPGQWFPTTVVCYDMIPSSLHSVFLPKARLHCHIEVQVASKFFCDCGQREDVMMYITASSCLHVRVVWNCYPSWGRTLWSLFHFIPFTNVISISISSVATTKDRTVSFSREEDFMRWFPVAFPSNCAFVMTWAGFELATTALRVRSLNQYTTAPHDRF